MRRPRVCRIPKGTYTTDPNVLPLNVEAVAEGRQRTHRNLCRAIAHFLARASEMNNLKAAQEELTIALRDNNQYGLVKWFFLREGSKTPPFRELRKNHRAIWATLVDSL